MVLDTSVFVNPDVRAALGDTPTEAISKFLEFASAMPHVEFYMPPSVYEELMNFIDRDKLPIELLLHLIQKSPMRYEMAMPAVVLYELIEDIRERVNRGMRIAETAIRGVPTRGVDEMIKDMRRKYRDALREGIIDSKEDVDLILLARELGATLVSADQGAIKWADKLGVKWLFPERFRDFLEAQAARAAAKPDAPLADSSKTLQPEDGRALR